MRLIACIVIALVFATMANAQDFFTSGPAIESGAFRAKYEEATAQVEVQKRLIADLRGIIRDLEAKHVCVCGEGCQCDAGGTPCPCPPRGKAKSAPVGKITMVSMEGCKACPVAEAYHGPRYTASGWAWSTRSDGKGKPGMWYPYYEVCIGDSCTVIQCRDIYELDARVTELIANRNQQPQHDKRGRFLGNW